MKMSIASWSVALSMLAMCAAASSHGCTATKGQLMLVFQTDMALPKDIDAIRILATLDGAVVYNELFVRLGDEGSIRLPATLGFLAPDDPSLPIDIRVTGYRGEDAPILRQIVTTIPEDRTATLQMPLQFLCNGSAVAERDESGAIIRDEDGQPVAKSNCEEGKTCVAGSCVDPEVDSSTLPDYTAAEIFGGGTGDGDGLCFDTTQCFEGATALQIERAADGTCRAPASGEINVALLTQGGGICSSSACYVALDANSDAGWKQDGDGFIRLPGAVCDQVLAGKLVGVISAPAGEGTCSKKAASLPTCGPWSSAGVDRYQPPDGAQPVPLVVGQTHPTSLWVSDTALYWTNGVTFDAMGQPNADGAVKTAPRSGGEPTVIAEGLTSPRDVVFDAAHDVVIWTNAGAGLSDGAIVAAVPGVSDAINLFAGLRQPEGLAVLGNNLYWTELWGDSVLTAGVTGTGTDVSKAGEPTSLVSGAPIGTSPYRIAAASDIVCWTYQGTLQGNDGVVACQRPGSAATTVATGQATPRALTLDTDETGSTRAVYWASFDGGSLFMADLSGGALGAQVEIASGLAQPNGVAVEADTVYWTNRGDGTVMKMPKSGGEPVLLAKDQTRPGDITVDTDAVYWINEGSPDLADGTPVKDGAILTLPK